MNEVYRTIAEGYEKLAAGYRALSEKGEKPDVPTPQAEVEKTLTIEEVRAVLSRKSDEGKTAQVKALLMKYKEGDQNSGQEGLDLLNELRAKRIYAGEGNVLEELPMQDADALLELCREERRRELCFEGQRWFDLRRYGMPRIEKIWCVNEQQNERYALEERDQMYVLAIPSEAMERNDKLEQNPGASQGTRMPL